MLCLENVRFEILRDPIVRDFSLNLQQGEVKALFGPSGCGKTTVLPDNIGLFVPYFVTLDLVDLLVTLLVFLILIFVLVYTAQRLANISGVGEIVEKFSRWIMAVIYIGLGLFIIIENNTIRTIISII